MSQGLRIIFERIPSDLPNSDVLYPGTQYVLPIALLCALSLMLTLLWSLAVWKYLWRSNTRSFRSPRESQTADQCPTEIDMTGHFGEMLR